MNISQLSKANSSLCLSVVNEKKFILSYSFNIPSQFQMAEPTKQFDRLLCKSTLTCLQLVDVFGAIITLTFLRSILSFFTLIGRICSVQLDLLPKLSKRDRRNINAFNAFKIFKAHCLTKQLFGPFAACPLKLHSSRNTPRLQGDWREHGRNDAIRQEFVMVGGVG